MFRALEYLGPVGLGATSPQLFRAETAGGERKVCVVKLSANRLGYKVLVNELLAARFGQWLTLCFPAGGIIEIPAEVMKKSRRLTAAGVKPGLHFGCEYLSRAGYVNKYNLHRATNKEQMAGVMLFDHLFHNPDRTINRKNLLIRRERDGYKLYAIDNSHLFRRGKWTIGMLRELTDTITINHRRSYGVLLKYYLHSAQFLQYAKKVTEIPRELFSQFVQDIPREWLPEQEERQALLEYITARSDKAYWVAEKLSELIPDINRRSNIH
ncbi:HipA family kinase [Sporomusa aerivorans]|uniref:HipA family kinase n=1 Tax=Sporomusa aerivorans TaxID=204936 RepID=UPI00352B2993